MLQEIPRQKNYCTDTALNTEYGVQNTNYKTIKKIVHVRTFQAVFIDERVEKIWKGFLIVRISVKI